MSHLPSSHANCEASKPPLVFPLCPSLRSRFAIVVSHRGRLGQRNDRSTRRNGRKTVICPCPMCSFSTMRVASAISSLPGRDGSGRFLIWQGVGLYTDEGRNGGSLREGGYEPHASRVFLWILPNAFDHSKCLFLFTYASLVPSRHT